MSGCIAVINAGSSSVKFAVYEASGEAHVLSERLKELAPRRI